MFVLLKSKIVFLALLSPLFLIGNSAYSQVKPANTKSSAANESNLPTLSSPIGNNSSTDASNSLGVPMGTGPGVHSPNSPFKPLPDRSDVIAWPVLTSVKTKLIKGRIIPNYGTAQTNLHKTTQRVQGYMMPLDAGKKQVHFILSSVPLTCQFCIPGGPESMVEVKTKTPVAYSTSAVVVEGQFLVLENDPYGLYYRMVDAVGVK